MMLTPNGPGNSEFQTEEIHFRNFSWDILWPKETFVEMMGRPSLSEPCETRVKIGTSEFPFFFGE